MARQSVATVVGSVANKTSLESSSVIEQIDNELYRSFKSFHKHSKDCRTCRNPVYAYQKGQDLCEVGRNLSIFIANLLYKKAEHVPQGTFIVDYPHGWEAVDGLIRIIVHYNQGYFSNEVADLKRVAQLAPPAIEDVPRGSGYEADLRRQQEAYSKRSSPHRSNASVYGDPRTSYLDTTTIRTQADVSPASSSRSVHWDSHIHVREFRNSP